MNYVKELIRYWIQVIVRARAMDAVYTGIIFAVYFVFVKVDWANAAGPQVKDWGASDWALIAFALMFEVGRNAVTQPLAREKALRAELIKARGEIERYESGCPVLSVSARARLTDYTEDLGTNEESVEKAIFLVLVIANSGGKAKEVTGEWRALTEWPPGATAVFPEENYNVLWAKNRTVGSVPPTRVDQITLLRCPLKRQRVDFVHSYQSQVRAVSVHAPRVEMSIEIWLDSEPPMKDGAMTGQLDVIVQYGADNVPHIDHRLTWKLPNGATALEQKS